MSISQSLRPGSTWVLVSLTLFPLTKLCLTQNTQKQRTDGEEAGAEGGGRDSPNLHSGNSTGKLLLFLLQGDWVWLKKFEAGTAPDLRPSCLSLLRKVGLQRARWGAVRRSLLIGLVPAQCGSFCLREEVISILMMAPHGEHLNTAYPSLSPLHTSIPIPHRHPSRVLIITPGAQSPSSAIT